jgi:hypothetical protein
MNPNQLILAAGLALFSVSNLWADTGKTKVSPTAPATESMIVLDDFESGSWGDWTVEGNAFGSQPFTGTKAPQVLLGRKGEGAVNSWAAGGDGATGKLTSKPFEISRPIIGFLLGGGKEIEGAALGVRLEVDGQVVRRATGRNSDAMEWVNWDVSELLGKTGRIIKAAFTGAEGWGSFSQKKEGENLNAEIALKWGKLRLRSISLATEAKPTSATVTVNGKAILVKSDFSDGKSTLVLEQEVSLAAGQSLNVSLDLEHR